MALPGIQVLKEFITKFSQPGGRQEKTTYRAIELASSSVKTVLISQTGTQLEIDQAKSVSFNPCRDAKEQEAAWKSALNQLLGSEKISNESIFLILNSPHVYFSQFIIPKISSRELPETLRWKLKDELPFPMEDAVLDYRLFDLPSTAKEPRFSALVAALPRTVTQPAEDALRSCRLTRFKTAFATFSIADFSNAFLMSTRHLVAVVDIGHAVTEIAFYSAGRLSFLRRISFGSSSLIETMTQSLATEKGLVTLTHDEAERAFMNEDLISQQNSSLVAGKIEAFKLFPLIRPQLEKLSGELKRSFDYYAHEHGEGVERIFLTGGASRLKNLGQYMERRLEVPVKFVDLSADITMSPSVKAHDLGPYFRCISLLADRQEPESSTLKIISEWKKHAEKLAHAITYMQLAAAFLMITVSLISGMVWQWHSIVQKRKSLESQIINLKPGFEEAQKTHAIEAKIRKAKLLADSLLSREPYWDDMFRELATAFPGDVILETVGYDMGTLTVKGIVPASNHEASVSKLALALEGPVFRKASLLSSERSENYVSFTIRCELA